MAGFVSTQQCGLDYPLNRSKWTCNGGNLVSCLPKLLENWIGGGHQAIRSPLSQKASFRATRNPLILLDRNWLPEVCQKVQISDHSSSTFSYAPGGLGKSAEQGRVTQRATAIAARRHTTLAVGGESRLEAFGSPGLA